MAESIPNCSFSAWRQEALKYDPDLALRLEEAPDPYAVAAGMGLRVPEYRRFDTVGTFLHDPDRALQPLLDLGITTFYAGARTTAPGLAGFRNDKDPLRADQIVPFLISKVSPEHYDNYNLRVAEFLSGVCVVAQISRGGTVYLDIARGTLPPLTGGQISPEFVATNEPSDENLYGTLQYFTFVKDTDGVIHRVFLPAEDESSVLNTSVRTAIWDCLRSLPVQDVESDIHVPRLPGRYEFAVVNHHGLDVAIFGDVQPFSRISIE